MDNLAVANILPATNAVQASGQFAPDAAGGSSAGLGTEGAFGELLSKQIALLDPQLQGLDVLIVDSATDVKAIAHPPIITDLSIQPIDPALLIQQIAPLTTDDKQDADDSDGDDFVALSDASVSLTPSDLSAVAMVIPVGNLPPSSAAVTGVAGKDLPPEIANIASSSLSPVPVTDKQVVAVNSQAETSDEFNAALAARLGVEKSKGVGANGTDQPQPQVQAQQNISTQAQTANAAPASAGIPQQVGAPHWDTGLGDKVVWMLGTQTKVAELHLNPPALGPLEVRINISDGRANLTFMTQHNAVGAAIESAKSRLSEMMGDSGVNMGSVSVNVGSFAQQQQQQTQQQGSQTPDIKSVTDIAWLPEDESVQTVTTTIQSLRDRGLVDLFA